MVLVISLISHIFFSLSCYFPPVFVYKGAVTVIGDAGEAWITVRERGYAEFVDVLFIFDGRWVECFAYLGGITVGDCVMELYTACLGAVFDMLA